MIGGQIRAARQAAGLSLRGLARRLPMNPGYLSQIERGHRLPSADLLARLSDVLGVEMELPAEVGEPVPDTLNPDVPGHLAEILARQRRLEDAIGARPLLVPTAGQLSLVTGLVVDARGSLRRPVLDVAAQWAQFGGWLHTAAADYRGAALWFDRAADWALENDDPNMISTVLNLRGYIAWKRGQLGAMLGLSQAAQRDRRATRGLLAVAAQQEARAHALLGDAEGADRKLDEAIEHAEAADPDAEPPWVYFYGADYLRMQRGRAYRYLGRYAEAAELLAAGLGALPVEMRGAEWAQSYAEDLRAVRAAL
ncbi:MAG: helix-turn-helix domain-containing protein [Dehalococcoidia bacterium]